jgi:hypothetical protein
MTTTQTIETNAVASRYIRRCSPCRLTYSCGHTIMRLLSSPADMTVDFECDVCRGEWTQAQMDAYQAGVAKRC